ncbi:hypothetical protein BDB01DRAFT_815445 [Pilobolus umbonatus]|nr:hypothetical protein BDB01DRAFT_815445 [Pilobolus umbonatus]
MTDLVVIDSTVHNEVTFNSLEKFQPNTMTEKYYKQTMLESPSYTQAGSFFPDWGYQCLGYNQQSEDAHWPTFIKTAINYIREVYDHSIFHTDTHVKGLISFVFAIMSHDMADVKWHSLGGLADYFIVAMGNSDFHGNIKDSHFAADAGAEFTLRHSNDLSYLNQTWQVPVKDLIEIYKRLYASSSIKRSRVPLESHLIYCMKAAFAASKIDKEFGKMMFGYYGSKSPFLVEELYDYNRGGLHDLSESVSRCYSELINAFENGAIIEHPDVLCASYFNTDNVLSNDKCLGDKNTKNEAEDAITYEYYDEHSGIFTITRSNHNQVTFDDTFQLPVTTYAGSRGDNPLILIQSTDNLSFEISNLPGSHCQSLNDNGLNDLYGLTLILPAPTVSMGYHTVKGDFNGDDLQDMAISAPYHINDDRSTGAVFILNGTEALINDLRNDSNRYYDIRDVSTVGLNGYDQGGRFGWSMATIDINEDGIDDLAVSAPFSQGGSVFIYLGRLHIGLLDKPDIRINIQGQEALGTKLFGADVYKNGFKDLLIGCPLCSVNGNLQAGVVHIHKSNPSNQLSELNGPDISIYNPNPDSSYDHFGESIEILHDTLLIGSPGYSSGSDQRIGRVYAYDLETYHLKWTITGAKEFQQFGREMNADHDHFLAVSSPSEETVFRLQRYWQGGSVRIYDINQLEEMYRRSRDAGKVGDFALQDGLTREIKGRTNAGHLGQSISFFQTENNSRGLWIGEPMSDNENGRVYKWYFGDDQIKCMKNDVGLMARFGSKVTSLSNSAISITSQRYGTKARYSGAIHLVSF